MKAIHSQDTGPEKKLPIFLHGTGLRFRKDVEPIPGIRCKADIVFRKYPKIVSAAAIDNHTLLIEFDNRRKKKYDVTPLLKKEMFSALKNPAFFKSVRNARSELLSFGRLLRENING